MQIQNMKTILLSALCLFSVGISQAQEATNKVILKKGDVIKVNSDIMSSMTQPMMGDESAEMKTSSKSLTVLEVTEELPNGYKLSKTLKTLTFDFDGFGQTTSYNSEKDAKTESPFLKPIAEKVGITEEIMIGFDGKEIEKEDKDLDKNKKGPGRRGGFGGMGGLMKMGNGVSAAFQLIPKGALENMGWEDTTEKDGFKTRRKYKIGGMLGNMAKIYVQSQTTGETEMNQAGKQITNKVNNTAEEMILVNIETGRVQMQTINGQTHNKTIVDDKERPSSGTTSVTITVE